MSTRTKVSVKVESVLHWADNYDDKKDQFVEYEVHHTTVVEAEYYLLKEDDKYYLADERLGVPTYIADNEDDACDIVIDTLNGFADDKDKQYQNQSDFEVVSVREEVDFEDEEDEV